MKTWHALEFSLSGSRIVGAERRVIWCDIETRKVEAPVGWSQKRRWAPFMMAYAGAMDPGIFFCDVVSGEEAELVDNFKTCFEDFEVRYAATREFDEMVLRGRFTNARRAHSTIAGSWPNLDSVSLKWNNRRKVLVPETWNRAADVLSVEVPAAWERGEGDCVALHCLRDVVELVLRDPEVEMTDSLEKQLVAIVS